jgi:hypothetical protein
MKNLLKRWGWPFAKGLLAIAIVVAVGRQFLADLRQPELAELELHPGWLVLSGALYLVGLLLSAWFWHHLLHVFGQRPHLLAVLRAYFLGHLGKYVPGKAWALLLRGGSVRGPRVRFGVAIVASFYEVLTTMAAGALLAALAFVIDPPDVPGLAWHPLLTGLFLLIVCGLPLLPGVFNFVVGRMGERFARLESFRLPRLRLGTLLLGLLATTIGWGFVGLSGWAALQAVLPEPPGLTLLVWLRCCGSIALAYVAGFVVVFMPSGIGVREYFLVPLLAFAGPRPLIVAAVLWLRLVWTASEVVLAGLLLTLPREAEDVREEPRPQGESSSPGGTAATAPTGLEDSPRGFAAAVFCPRPLS